MMTGHSEPASAFGTSQAFAEDRATQYSFLAD